MSEKYDVAVIGSGPAGTTAATLLAKKGYRVALIEREKFPRFHVGESLLPATQEIWEKMGVAEPLQHSGHTFKYGADVRVGRSPDSANYLSSKFFFHNVPRKDRGVRPYAYQVERAVFDKQLQDAAVKHGVHLLDETSVEEVVFSEGPRGKKVDCLRLRKKDQSREELCADFVIDASGRRCVIARQLNCIENDPTIKTSAVFSHFTGVQREEGYRQGFFRLYFLPHGWMWLIPLANDVMSVGVVQNEVETSKWPNDPEKVLYDTINKYDFVKQHFTNAVHVARVRSIRGLAYETSEFCGDGWISIGDANFFVDPLYSSGVHVAQSTGERASEVVDEFLKGGRDMGVIERYRKYITVYRRDVFSIIRTMYRMLRNRSAIATFVWLVGPFSGNFDTWFLRRVAAWSSGYFQRNWLVMRVAEAFGNTIATIVPPVTRLCGDIGWKRFETGGPSAPRLEFTKKIHEATAMTAPGEENGMPNIPARESVPASC